MVRRYSIFVQQHRCIDCLIANCAVNRAPVQRTPTALRVMPFAGNGITSQIRVVHKART